MADMSYSEALRFRDSVMSWIDQRIAQTMPGPKYGTTTETYDKSGAISVLLNGESTPTKVYVNHIVPAVVGVVVKVDGPPNNRQIVDVVQDYSADLQVYSVSGYSSFFRDNSMGTGYMTATDTDKWQTQSYTGTVNGAANTFYTSEYRVTFDRWVDVRFSLTFNNVPTAGFINFAVAGQYLPTAITLGMASPSVIYAYGTYAGPTNTTTGIIRVSNGQVLWSSIPAIKQNYQGSISYSITKPTF